MGKAASLKCQSSGKWCKSGESQVCGSCWQTCGPKRPRAGTGCISSITLPLTSAAICMMPRRSILNNWLSFGLMMRIRRKPLLQGSWLSIGTENLRIPHRHQSTVRLRDVKRIHSGESWASRVEFIPRVLIRDVREVAGGDVQLFSLSGILLIYPAVVPSNINLKCHKCHHSSPPLPLQRQAG